MSHPLSILAETCQLAQKFLQGTFRQMRSDSVVAETSFPSEKRLKIYNCLHVFLEQLSLRTF